MRVGEENVFYKGSVFGRKTLSEQEKYLTDLHCIKDNFLSVTGRLFMSVRQKRAPVYHLHNNKTEKVT